MNPESSVIPVTRSLWSHNSEVRTKRNVSTDTFELPKVLSDRNLHIQHSLANTKSTNQIPNLLYDMS